MSQELKKTNSSKPKPQSGVNRANLIAKSSKTVKPALSKVSTKQQVVRGTFDPTKKVGQPVKVITLSKGKLPIISLPMKLGDTLPEIQKLINEPMASSIIDDVISTGMSVAKTATDLIEGNPQAIVDIPNTIMKVIDTTSNIIRNVKNSDATEKVVLKDKVDVSNHKDTVVIEKLRDSMPVITMTQIPTAYSTEYRQNPLVFRSLGQFNGRDVIEFNGSYALLPVLRGSDGHETWSNAMRLTPSNPACFGTALFTHLELFQMYKIIDVTDHYIPICGTDTHGTVILNFNDGTDIGNHFHSDKTYQDVSQREHVMCTSSKMSTNLTIKGKGDWLYISASEPGDSLKFFISMTAGQMCALYEPTQTTRHGYIQRTFKIQAMSRMESGYSFKERFSKFLQSQWISHCMNSINYSQFLAILYHYLGFLLLEDSESHLRANLPEEKWDKMCETVTEMIQENPDDYDFELVEDRSKFDVPVDLAFSGQSPSTFYQKISSISRRIRETDYSYAKDPTYQRELDRNLSFGKLIQKLELPYSKSLRGLRTFDSFMDDDSSEHSNSDTEPEFKKTYADLSGYLAGLNDDDDIHFLERFVFGVNLPGKIITYILYYFGEFFEEFTDSQDKDPLLISRLLHFTRTQIYQIYRKLNPFKSGLLIIDEHKPSFEGSYTNLLKMFGKSPFAFPAVKLQESTNWF